MWSNAPVLEHCLRRILSADVSERWRRSQNAQIQHEALYHGNSPLRRKSSKGKAYKKGARRLRTHCAKTSKCKMATRTNKRPTSNSATNATSQPTPLESLGGSEMVTSSETTLGLVPSAPKKGKAECRWSRGTSHLVYSIPRIRALLHYLHLY